MSSTSSSSSSPHATSEPINNPHHSNMCFSCGGWPWPTPVPLAAEPVKEEHIFLDQNHAFYPDYRTSNSIYSHIFTLLHRILTTDSTLISFTLDNLHFDMPTYYSYKDPYPSSLNDPNAGHWENPDDWPRTFRYIPAHTYAQGIHQAAPTYQTNQPQQTMYYYPGGPAGQPGYYMNGAYLGPQQPQASGWQFPPTTSYTCYPLPTQSTAFPYGGSPPFAVPAPGFPSPQMPMNMSCPWSAAAATAQAASALAANAQLAATPNAPAYFVGATAADIATQNAIIAMNAAAANQMPSQLAPFKPGSSQQFWCKEMDGSWTLREYNDVVMGELGSGHWERHPTSGYNYYVRHTL